MFYNVKVKYFNGSRQYFYSEKMLEKGFEVDKSCWLDDGSSVERKEEENLARAKQKIYDYARMNKFMYFATFTFNPAVVNRWDYDSCSDALQHFTDLMGKQGCSWLIVPEQHKDGAYHFHGLISGNLKLTQAINAKTGLPMFDKTCRPIYNILNFKYGHTEVTEIGNQARVATYVAKYFSKAIEIPKGRKRYWTSGDLELPSEELLVMSTSEFGEIYNAARFVKESAGPYGMFLMCEVDT